MQRRCVDDVNLVAALDEPNGVRARSAAHVEHDGGRRGNVSEHDLARSVALDEARSAFEPPGLDASLVMAQHVFGDRHARNSTLIRWAIGRARRDRDRRASRGRRGRG